MERIQSTNVAEQWLPGQIFGRYKLIKKLGAGGMASVFLAEQRGEQGFSRKVALKIVHPHLALQEDFEAYFVSEARLGGVLHHPNLLATLDFGQAEGRWFMSMEYVDGWTLSELVRALPQPHALHHHPIYLQVLIQVCRGLAYAHAAQDAEGRPLRIVHRDIKPSNILIDRHGSVKLADFGVARAESNLHQTAISGVIKGSLRYLSPEQALANRDIDGRADLYSLGLVLYFVLTGRPAYQSDNEMQVLRMAMDGAVDAALAQLPAWPYRSAVLSVLTRLWARERAERYENAEVVEQALLELQEQVGLSPVLSARWLQTHLMNVAPPAQPQKTNAEVTIAEPASLLLSDKTASEVSVGSLSLLPSSTKGEEEEASEVGFDTVRQDPDLVMTSEGPSPLRAGQAGAAFKLAHTLPVGSPSAQGAGKVPLSATQPLDKAEQSVLIPVSLWDQPVQRSSTEPPPTVEVPHEAIPHIIREQLGPSRPQPMVPSPEGTFVEVIRPRSSSTSSSPAIYVEPTTEALPVSRPSTREILQPDSLLAQPMSQQAAVLPLFDIRTRPLPEPLTSESSDGPILVPAVLESISASQASVEASAQSQGQGIHPIFWAMLLLLLSAVGWWLLSPASEPSAQPATPSAPEEPLPGRSPEPTEAASKHKHAEVPSPAVPNKESIVQAKSENSTSLREGSFSEGEGTSTTVPKPAQDVVSKKASGGARLASKGRLRINAGSCSQLLLNGTAFVFESLENGCIVTDRVWPSGALEIIRLSSDGHRVVVNTVVSPNTFTICAIKSTLSASSCKQEALDPARSTR